MEATQVNTYQECLKRSSMSKMSKDVWHAFVIIFGFNTRNRRTRFLLFPTWTFLQFVISKWEIE